MKLIVVTDRRLVDGDELVDRLRAVVGAVPRGSVLVQVREKDLDGGPLIEMVRAIQGVGAAVWVNDRVDVALAAAAEGVHLPERGMAVADVRAIAPGLAIGCSRHGAEAVRERVDLVQLGPIWPTPSKAGVIEPLGEAVLAVRAEMDPDVRLVAVGGVDGPARARAAARAGADAVAVIRAIWTASDPGAAAAALVAAVDEGIALRTSTK